MKLSVNDLHYRYPKSQEETIQGLSFSFDGKVFLTILGESGSGKSTLLKLLAGLLFPNEGTICMDGEDVTEYLPMSRDVTMVFQEDVLFPHMNLYQNVRMGLNRFPLSEEEKDARTKGILKQFGLLPYLNFKPRHLSSGQCKRACIAKALIREPGLFLLDEPLSALDLPQRRKILAELRRIYDANSASFLYVTHSVQEAEALNADVLLIDRGKVLQQGSLTELYEHPASLDAMRLLESGRLTILEGEIRSGVLSFGEFSFPFHEEDGPVQIGIPYGAVLESEDGVPCQIDDFSLSEFGLSCHALTSKGIGLWFVSSERKKEARLSVDLHRIRIFPKL